MRRRNILLGTLAIAVVVATIGGVAYALHTRAQVQPDWPPYPGLDAPVSVACPGVWSAAGRGWPAIHPRNDCTPSFTQQDVRDYLAANGVTQGPLWTNGDSRPAVTRVVFLTVGDLGLAPGDIGWELNGRPDMLSPDTLVCYAGLNGTFAYGKYFGLSGAFSTGGIPDYVFDPFGPPLDSERASIVYDAHTGNELVDGMGAPLG